MKKLLSAALLLVPSLAVPQANLPSDFVQINKAVICGPVETIFKGLAHTDVQEKPIWIGKDESEKTDFVLFVNPKTRAFTILQIGQTIGCIIGLGYDSRLLDGQKL